jgi:hypothetical protein
MWQKIKQAISNFFSVLGNNPAQGELDMYIKMQEKTEEVKPEAAPAKQEAPAKKPRKPRKPKAAAPTE